jgi:hypothetical protein
VSARHTLDRRTFLFGLAAAALPLERVVTRNKDLVTGLARDYVSSTAETLTASDFFRFGSLAQLAAFTYFPVERDGWLAYVPCVGTFYADNWSMSRIVSTAILQEQARSQLANDDAAVLTDDLQRALKGLDQYKLVGSAPSDVRYAGHPPGSSIVPDDVWCDDNAWIMRNYLAIYRMTKDPTALATVEALFRFEVSNWQQQAACDPGGIPWIQPRSREGNHDRNTVSNAPVAMAGYELYLITNDPFYRDWASRIDDYQMKYFVDGTRVYDHIDTNCNVDRSFWAYTYGVVIGMNRLRHIVAGADPSALAAAESIAKASLDTFESNAGASQPATFVDIYFQELCQLYQLTQDDELRMRIPKVIVNYAKALWSDGSVHKSNHLFRDANFDLFDGIPYLRFKPHVVSLANQAGVANIYYTAACVLTV